MEGGSAVSQLSVHRAGAQKQLRQETAAGMAQYPVADDNKRTIVLLKPAAGVESLPASFYQRTGKRVFDVVFSTAFLVVVGSWLFPILAIAIRANSKGPVLFRQRRVGLHGEVFTCLKFRTMAHRPDAGFVQAQKDDCRITTVGRFLRRTNLDEVPQFINVLLGDMSVIGPRPHVPELDGMFEDLIPTYTQRNSVKPGVSGLAQVSGCRGETRSVREMSHRIRFDVFYCRNVSLSMDIKLIALTVVRALRGDERAY